MKGIAYVAFFLVSLSAAFLAQAQIAAQTKSAQRTYTAAEYEAYQTAEAEQDANKRVRLIDDFISQHPKSALLIYVYPLCYQTHSLLKNYPRVMDCADELVQLGEHATVEARYMALYAATNAYNKLNSDNPELAAKARTRALAGAKLLSSLKRPETLGANEFDAEKRRATIYFEGTAGRADMMMKDYPGATNALKAIVAEIDSIPIGVGIKPGP